MIPKTFTRWNSDLEEFIEHEAVSTAEVELACAQKQIRRLLAEQRALEAQVDALDRELDAAKFALHLTKHPDTDATEWAQVGDRFIRLAAAS